MIIPSILKRLVCRVAAVSLLMTPLAPTAFAADINYDADTDVVVNSVRLTILANSKASRLVVGTTLVVDVPAGSNFFLVSRDGTALPNSVSINNENQAALTQACTQNAQGQSTENVLSIQGASSGTMRVTISPESGAKCQKAGGGASVGGSGGGGGGGGVAGTGSTTSSGTLPVAPTIIPGVTTTTPTAPAPTAPSTSATAPAPTGDTAAPLPPPPPPPVATAAEIKDQTSDLTDRTLDILARAIEAAPPVAPAAPGPSGSVSSAPAAPEPINVNVSSSAVTITDKFVPADATPRERAIMQVLVDNPPASVEARGKGEWGGALNSTRIANNGEIPTESVKLKRFVENAALVSNGRFPVTEFKNPELEQKSAGLLEIVYKRDLNPGEEVKEEIADRNAIVVATYGLRQQKRSAKAERAAAKVIDTVIVKTKRVKKNSGEYWNLVNAVAYSGAKRAR